MFFSTQYCYIILKGVLSPNTWASQKHNDLKYSGLDPVASKKNDAGASCPKFHRASGHRKNRPKRNLPTKKTIVNFQMTIMSNFM